jgi:peptide/nickel transport system ATP-binding protein
MQAPFVAVRDLAKTFSARRSLYSVLRRDAPMVVHAVDGVSFEIPRGKTFALVGESGSGKSTIAQLVVGLLRPTRGEILIDGTSIAVQGKERKALQRRIQMVFQDPYTSLNPRWRVGAVIAEPYGPLALPVPRDDVPDRVAELLIKVGLHPADAEKYPHEFSGGQRQRIAIARMLAAQAEFVVCDEPTSALDVSVQAQILNLMRDLQDEFGLTYLFISHNLAVVRFMADDVGVLKRGLLVEAGPAASIFDNPTHPYTRDLLAAVPDPDVTAGGPADSGELAGRHAMP